MIGGANMDIVAASRAALLAQDSNPGTVRYSPGGVGRNVAENLARLGQTVHLVSAVGTDMFGQTVREQTTAAGVDMAATLGMAAGRTATYVSVQGPDGDMAVAVNAMDIMDALTPECLGPHAELLVHASSWVVDCNVAPTTLDWLFQQAGPMPVRVDGVSVSKCLRILPYLAQIDTLKVNRQEAQALTCRPVRSPHDALGAAQALCDRGVRLAVISLGARGVVWCERGTAARLAPGATVPVQSTTGAGDALLAGIVDALSRAVPSADAVLWGMACAEMTLQSPLANAHQLRRAQVAEHLARRVVKAPDS